ncbi:MAG: hypothetical protein WBZ29_17840 [Methanocella sp.]
MLKFDDLGVSETIGYILVFAIVLTGIAGIVFFGVTMLNDAKDRNNFQNVEQGLTVVQSDMKRVALEKAPIKTSKLRVEGGSLALNNTTSAIRIDYAGHTYDNFTGDIIFDSNEYLKTISIQNGALWKSEGGPMSDLCIVEPRIFAFPEARAIVINVIRFQCDNTAVASAGTIGLSMEYVGNNVYIYDGPGSDLTITVNTTYPNAWARFFDETRQLQFFSKTTSVTSTAAKVTMSHVDEVVISEHTIKVLPITYYG